MMDLDDAVHVLRTLRVPDDLGGRLLGEARTVVLDELDELRDELDRQRTGERCCPDACNGGGCETCPCCSAGWCVRGRDGVPEDGEDFAAWIEVAAERNPVVAAWQRDRAALEALRESA